MPYYFIFLNLAKIRTEARRKGSREDERPSLCYQHQDMSRLKKQKAPEIIAGVTIDLLLPYEDLQARLEQAVEDSYSSKALYQRLLHRAAPQGTKDVWGKVAAFFARIISFFYGLYLWGRQEQKEAAKAITLEKLERYFYRTDTQIKIQEQKIARDIHRLDTEILDIENEMYHLESEQQVAQKTYHQQELEMMKNRFWAEKDLRKAKLELLFKYAEQLKIIERHYQREKSLQASRIKLEKLQLSGDDDLANLIEADEKIQVLKERLLLVGTAYDDTIKASDFEKIALLESQLKKL